MSRFVPRPSFLTGVDSQSPGADPDALDGGGGSAPSKTQVVKSPKVKTRICYKNEMNASLKDEGLLWDA